VYINRRTRELQNAPNIWYSIDFKPCRRVAQGDLKEYSFHLHVDRYDLNELPQGDKEIGEWLMDRWREKDERIERIGIETGSMPCERIFGDHVE
jgi:hypothetical protein